MTPELEAALEWADHPSCQHERMHVLAARVRKLDGQLTDCVEHGARMNAAFDRALVVIAEQRDRHEQDIEALVTLLRELTAHVRGDCPFLLNEDSGGDVKLSLAIDAALARFKVSKKGGQRMKNECKRGHHFFGDYEVTSRVGHTCSCGQAVITKEDAHGIIIETAPIIQLEKGGSV